MKTNYDEMAVKVVDGKASILSLIENQMGEKDDFYDFCKSENLPVNEESAQRYVNEEENKVMESQHQIL